MIFFVATTNQCLASLQDGDLSTLAIIQEGGSPATAAIPCKSSRWSASESVRAMFGILKPCACARENPEKEKQGLGSCEPPQEHLESSDLNIEFSKGMPPYVTHPCEIDEYIIPHTFSGSLRVSSGYPFFSASIVVSIFPSSNMG